MAREDEGPDAGEIKKAFVEAICLETQLSIEQLEELLSDPGFGAYGRQHDWRAYIPPEIVEAWPILTADAMIVAFYMAHTQYLKEASVG